jgi:RHH-type proline utilization regulon transcriptional repressor/proline dehydrogenase/delta 1-pyrroline-5-carboxylate dehydrogenase
MSLDAASTEVRPGDLADEAVATVRRWLAESAEIAPDPSAQRLAGLLQDPVGLDFAIGFVDRVVRPEDLRVAGRNLERLSRNVPAFLPWYLRVAIVFGGGFAPLLPWPIVPIARWALRRMVGHLVIDATPARLSATLDKLRQGGIRLNLNLLGEAVLGDDEADRRLAGTRELLARPDVDYVSIKVSSVASQLSMWAMDEMVERVVTRLTPLYELAASSATPKFINLDMEEYRDLDLTVAVFQTLLDRPALKNLEAGIVLQAYLPDALSALQGLTAWATERRKNGGAGIKVRLVKGANLAMERVDAALHGWPLATWGSKRETDTNYKRVLDWALTPQRTDAVRLGVAGHNLFDVAFAWLLAKARGVESRIEFEMLLGMATGQADAVRREVGGLLLYTPVVHPREFDSAISYLIRRLEENASPENFMSGLFQLATDETVFAREAERFLDSLATLDTDVPSSNRRQNRSAPRVEATNGFANEPDTDPAIAANRLWARGVLGRVASSRLGADTVAAGRLADESAVNAIVEAAAASGPRWSLRPLAERATILRAAGDELAASRADLIEVMASETGKTIAEGDVEVSEAIDFARYYAERTLELDAIDGATFTPPRLTLAIPPWNFPVAIPAGSVLAALAAGSAVIIKPAPQSVRSAAVMVEALWRAGVPRDVLVFADVREGPLGQALIAHPAVDRVILTGAWETAQLFRSWRSDLPLVAETSGKNAIIVTPSADLDLAVADIVKSAFGHAGQKCSAASLVILVGSVARSERFRRQLVDAVTSLRVGYPQDPTSQMGPLIEPARGKLLDALTLLGEGESWLVEPRQLDETGALWSPGVRAGVAPGSAFHRTEYFGPVLGVMAATTLEEAVDVQNGVDYGLTAGIHSLDVAELAVWLERVEAGNLYVNRGITGAIVRRQPFGGWKRSTVGPSAKAGGPNYLLSLGSFSAVEREPDDDIIIEGLSDEVASVVKKSQTGIDFAEFDRVRRAALSDQAAWQSEFGVSRDVSGLGVERNVFRYRPVPVTLRLSEGASLGDLIRLIAAAARTRSPITISTAIPLPTPLTDSFEGPLPSAVVDDLIVETDAAWLARATELTTPRVRLIGGDPLAFAEAIEGTPDVAVWSGPVTTAGRIELLPFLHEQAVSITAHRFGNPDRELIGLPV